MNSQLVFKASAVIEVLTGIGLLTAPVFVTEMLIGGDLSITGIAVTRILGVTLISLGVAAWEPPEYDHHQSSRAGLCIYNIGIAIGFSDIIRQS